MASSHKESIGSIEDEDWGLDRASNVAQVLTACNLSTSGGFFAFKRQTTSTLGVTERAFLSETVPKIVGATAREVVGGAIF